VATDTPNQAEPESTVRPPVKGHRADCGCRPCKAARRRAEEAIAHGDRERAEVALVKVQEPDDDAIEEPPIQADIVTVSRRDARSRIAEWALLRSQGMKTKDIAAQMGIQPQSLHTLISKAARQGWLQFSNPAERLEHELAPLIVDNIKSHLLEGDKKMTIEAAKGIGLFKSHQAVKVENESPQMVLALKIETPVGFDPTSVVTGTIIGVPKVPTE
jgi:transposase